MRIRVVVAVLAVFFGLAMPRDAQAQAYLGPHLAWGEDADFALGLRAGLGLSRLLSTDPNEGALTRFEALLVFDWFLDCDNCNYLEVTPAVTVPIRLSQEFAVYLGTGLNIARFSTDLVGVEDSDTDLGLALLGGLEFPLGPFTSFGEVRATLGGREQTVLSFGLLFGPG